MSVVAAFKLISPIVRENARRAVLEAPAGYEVFIKEPGRTLDQGAAFHALCNDIAKTGPEWFGKRRSAES